MNCIYNNLVTHGFLDSCNIASHGMKLFLPMLEAGLPQRDNPLIDISLGSRRKNMSLVRFIMKPNAKGEREL
jgi:hypothetical protein